MHGIRQAGRPIIVADGTALPGVTFSPECGISIPQYDVPALIQAIVKLRNNPYEGKKRGELGQRLAREHYRYESYYQKHKELYASLLER